MADRFDAATRSRIMRAIKGSNTKPELKLAAALLELGVPPFSRPQKTSKKNGGLPGSPDIVFEGCRLAVFVHGCYWHRCPVHYKESQTRAAAWREHMDKNVRRDRRVRRQLNKSGWKTTVAWEHEAPAVAARRIAARLTRIRDEATHADVSSEVTR